MTATGHALVATLLVAKISNPYISLPLCFLSHFALDLVPHWDTGLNHQKKSKKKLFTQASIDVAISFAASYVLYHSFLGQNNYALLYAGVILSQLPDWITAPYLIFRYKSPLVIWSKHMYHVQHVLNHRVFNPFWGILTQVATVLLLYIILFRIF